MQSLYFFLIWCYYLLCLRGWLWIINNYVYVMQDHCVFIFQITHVTTGICCVCRVVILELQVVVYCLPLSSTRLLTYWWHISISIVIRFKYPLIPHSWRAFQMKSHLGKGLDKLIQNVHFKSMKCVLWFHLAPSLQNLSCRPELNIENIKQQVE